jgi:hypothetical protein
MFDPPTLIAHPSKGVQPQTNGKHQASPRVDFQHLSSHASRAKPGFYLILLRTEIKHRTLREKPLLDS